MESKEELLKQLRQSTVRWIELDHRYKDLLFDVTGKTEDDRPARIADSQWCTECDLAGGEAIAAHNRVVEIRKKLEELAEQSQ